MKLFLKEEEEFGIKNYKTYQDFSKKIYKNRENVIKNIYKIKGLSFGELMDFTCSVWVMRANIVSIFIVLMIWEF